MRILAIFLTLALLSDPPVIAHGGGLAADGCHNDRKRGGRHCHRSSYTPASAIPKLPRLPRKKARTSATAKQSGQIKTAQKLLNRLGYNAGKPDGAMGGKTRSAISNFQRDNDFAIRMIVDDRLIDQLISALAK